MKQSPSWEVYIFLVKSSSSPQLMEAKGSLQCSQQPTVCLYPVEYESSPVPPPSQFHFFEILLIITHPSSPRSSKWFSSLHMSLTKACMRFSSPLYISVKKHKFSTPVMHFITFQSFLLICVCVNRRSCVLAFFTPAALHQQKGNSLLCHI